MNINDLQWEKILETDNAYETFTLSRIKVDGGHIYREAWDLEERPALGLCFVPDVDLQRYQSHLRDAYTQGYKAGQEDAKLETKNPLSKDK
jgi:hypothetical protein